MWKFICVGHTTSLFLRSLGFLPVEKHSGAAAKGELPLVSIHSTFNFSTFPFTSFPSRVYFSSIPPHCCGGAIFALLFKLNWIRWLGNCSQTKHTTYIDLKCEWKVVKKCKMQDWKGWNKRGSEVGTAAILLGAMNLQVFSSQPLGSATVSPLCCLPGLVSWILNCAHVQQLRLLNSI